MNCHENLKTTLREINQSKGKAPLLTWLKSNLRIRFEIDDYLTLKNYEIAKRAVEELAKKLRNS